MAKEQDVWLLAAHERLKKMPAEALEIREMAKSNLRFFAKLVNPGYIYGDVHLQTFDWMQEYSLF